MRKGFPSIGALMFFATTAHADVWYVHPDSALNSIQIALNSCANNDTVLVGPGTYYENIIWPNTQGIDLISEFGLETTIIDGDSSGSVIEITTDVDTSTVIKGFTIRNGSSSRGGGISGGSATIINNIIARNTGGGIESVGKPMIANNIVTGNTGRGIYCQPGHNDTITIANNTITANTSSGIECYEGYLYITGNTISGNTGCGINSDYAKQFQITNNTITNNTGSGIGFYANRRLATITHNIITGNTAAYGGGGINCQGWATITNNTITGNTGPYGGGICIWGAFGVHGTIANNIITGNTAIDGGGIYGLGSYDGAGAYIIDNIIADNTATERGGGICCTDAWLDEWFGMEVARNTINGNTAAWGGGIYVHSYCGEFSYIDDNMIANNNATQQGGGIYCSDSALGGMLPPRPIRITNNRIISNNAPDGSGILCCWFSTARIEYCTISANMGDGVYSVSNANPVIHYNNISDNRGYGVRNKDLAVMVAAENNWWGDPSGPGGYGPGTGDEISDNVSFIPWFDCAAGIDSTWPTFRHDKHHTGLSPLTGDMDFVEYLWSQMIGNKVRSSPALGDIDEDGRLEVVACSDLDSVDNVYALNAEDGSLLWSYALDRWVESSPALGDIDGDGRLEAVVGSHDGNVYAFNGEDGRVLWAFTTGLDIHSSPALGDIDDDGKLEVIIGSEDHNVYALNGEDGSLLWSYTTGHVVRSSPAVGDVDLDGKLEVLIGSFDGNVYAFNGDDGSLCWSYATGTWVWSSPTVGDIDDDGQHFEVVVGSDDGTIYTLNGEDGSLLWSTKVGKVESSPAFGDIDGDGSTEVVIGSSDHNVYALKGEDGSFLWSYTTDGAVRSSPALADIDSDDSLEVVVGSFDGKIYALNGGDGHFLWHFPTGAVRSSPALGDIDSDGRLEVVVSSYDGRVYALNGYSVGINETTAKISDSSSFLLLQNVPNPLVNNTVIRYSLHRLCKVELKVFDVTGRQIAILVDEYQKPGYYHSYFDTRTVSQKLLPNGIYFYRLTTGDSSATKKMIICR